MSFAGHVSDMIRRNKENREMLDRLRQSSKEAKTKYAAQIPDITAEELEEINRRLHEREQQEQRYAFYLKIKLLAITMGLVVLAAMGLYFFG